MSETSHQDLSGVAETLLIPLCYRAIETQRPDALIKDEKAVGLVKQLSSDGPIRYDSGWIKQTPMAEANKVMRIMLTREMDRYARDFLSRHPEAVVVHIGCGLDSRFDRVAERNSQVEWYDLDLPDVIELRRKLIGDEGGRYHLLGCNIAPQDVSLAVVVQVLRPGPPNHLASRSAAGMEKPLLQAAPGARQFARPAARCRFAAVYNAGDTYCYRGVSENVC